MGKTLSYLPTFLLYLTTPQPSAWLPKIPKVSFRVPARALLKHPGGGGGGKIGGGWLGRYTPPPGEGLVGLGWNGK